MSHVLVVDDTEIEENFYGLICLCSDNFRLDPEPQTGRGFHRHEPPGNCLEGIQNGMILLFQLVSNGEVGFLHRVFF